MNKKSILLSVGHAIDGLAHCLRTQKHMRLHFVLALLVMIGAVLLHVSDAQFLALLFSVTLVIVAEMLNTGIEITVDMIKPTYDPRAKIIKDVAAGAVLLSSMSAAFVGLLVYFHSPVVTAFRQHAEYPEYESNWPELCVESLVILLILITAWKTSGGEGSILRNGPISGRSAFGFFCLVLIVVNPDPEVRIGSAVAMVILVLLGRSETTRQTVRQLVLGALVGIIVPGFVITAHYALTRPGSHVPRLAPRSELSRMDVDGTFSVPPQSPHGSQRGLFE